MWRGVIAKDVKKIFMDLMFEILLAVKSVIVRHSVLCEALGHVINKPDNVYVRQMPPVSIATPAKMVFML